MDKVYVLFQGCHLIGVYTSHRKAIQTMILETIGRKLQNYSFQIDTEFFTYTDSDDDTFDYELMEITPDERA